MLDKGPIISQTTFRPPVPHYLSLKNLNFSPISDRSILRAERQQKSKMALNSFSMSPGRPERACWLSHSANIIISIIHIMKLTNEKQLKLIKLLFSFTFVVLFCSFIFQFHSIQILFYSNAFGEMNRIIIRRRGRWMVDRIGWVIW